jgi:uncharacterized surface anchored protein
LNAEERFLDEYLRVAVEKRDNGGIHLPDAVFGIFTDAQYQANSGGLSAASALITLTTGANGFAVTEEAQARLLAPGVYWLAEVEPPRYYLNDFAPQSFTVTDTSNGYLYNFTGNTTTGDAGGTGQPVINTVATGALRIWNVDDETNLPLRNGTFVVERIETFAPGAWERFLDGMSIVQTPGVTFAKQGDSLIVRINEPADAADIHGIPWGQYFVREITPASAYAIQDSAPRIVKIGEPVMVGMEYAPMAEVEFRDMRIRLRLSKTNPAGMPLAGAVFSLKNTQGVTVCTLPPTDADGYTETTAGQLIQPGTYMMVETAPPFGYTAYTSEIRFTVGMAQSAWVFNLTGQPGIGDVFDAFTGGISGPLVDPYAMGGMVLETADKETASISGLNGAVFEVTPLSGQPAGEWTNFLSGLSTHPQNGLAVATSSNTLQATTTEGQVSVSGVPWGSYAVRQVMAPRGYVLDDTNTRTLYIGNPQTQQTGTQQTYALNVRERFRVSRIRIEIEVINQFNNPLPGAVFNVERLDDPAYAGNSYAYETLTTDSGGRARSYQLYVPGRYRLVQFRTAQYNDITFEPVEFAVAAGQTQAIINFTVSSNGSSLAENHGPVENLAETGSVRVHKTDDVSGENLAGAAFRLRQVSARDATLVLHEDLSATTNEYGNATFTEVPYGYYELVETMSPSGYSPSTQIQYITVSRDLRDKTYALSNDRIVGNLAVHKYAMGNSGQTESLAGAKFTLTGTSRFGDNVNMLGTTDDTGFVYFNNLPAATYTLTEVEAPSDEFVKAGSREVVIARQGERVVASVRNYRIGEVMGAADPEAPSIHSAEDMPFVRYMGTGTMIIAMVFLLRFAHNSTPQGHPRAPHDNGSHNA